MSFRWLAIVNPTAGGGRAGRRWQELARALRARGVLFDAITTATT
jgi:diacylglycerol kinase family enzyme